MTAGPSGAPPVEYDVVIPSLVRPSLGTLLESLATQEGPMPREVVVVDDRPARRHEAGAGHGGDSAVAGDAGQPLTVPSALTDRVAVRILTGFGRGPAAARNLGWRVTRSEWVVFVDDDVELTPDWSRHLAADLGAAGPRVGGIQARLDVPFDGRPTDWQRATLALTGSRWITADMAYRRAALEQVHGFDERFRRAYREDADLALRIRRAGWTLVRGARVASHPVRPQPRWDASVVAQRGNADDALLRALHGPAWRELTDAGPGRLPLHVATVLGGVTALAGLVTAASGHRRTGRLLGAVGAACWGALSADFTARRLLAGPADPAEVARMVATSLAIPPVAVAHRLRGAWAHRHALPWPPRARVVLFDRDGTLVRDVPYNDDPARVEALPTVAPALAALRVERLRVGVVTNQSGVGRGLVSAEAADAVRLAVESELGPFATWQECRHAPEVGCACRKPEPGLVLAAAAELNADPGDCVVIGDIGSDVIAARAAGARAILVPNDRTRPSEVADAPFVAADLLRAARLVLEGAV